MTASRTWAWRAYDSDFWNTLKVIGKLFLQSTEFILPQQTFTIQTSTATNSPSNVRLCVTSSVPRILRISSSNNNLTLQACKLHRCHQTVYHRATTVLFIIIRQVQSMARHAAALFLVVVTGTFLSTFRFLHACSPYNYRYITSVRTTRSILTGKDARGIFKPVILATRGTSRLAIAWSTLYLVLGMSNRSLSCV
jgi:hypothetical protein